VLHSNDLNQVTWGMRVMEGAPKSEERQRIPDVSYEGFARSLGLYSLAVNQPGQVGPAWDQALAAGRPTVLDLRTGPSIPPIPPHATFEQAKDAAMARLKDDADRWAVLKEGVITKAGGSCWARGD
jgi:pyruvate dehydrogenase (quinone)